MSRRGLPVPRPPGTELGPAATLILRNNDLQVTILPAKGADIYALADRRTGVDVLFKSPWGTRSPGPWLRAATSMERWVEAYPGGWQVLLPNGGDECVEQGVTWGYHGEAALVPWEVTGTGDTWATLETRLFTVPLRIEREFTLDGQVLRLAETVTNESAEPPRTWDDVLELSRRGRVLWPLCDVDAAASMLTLLAGLGHPLTFAAGHVIDRGAARRALGTRPGPTLSRTRPRAVSSPGPAGSWPRPGPGPGHRASRRSRMR